MKTRIIALILTVVMSILTLCSCGSYDFAEATIDYATFNEAAFEEGLKNIKIEDGSFTTDGQMRDTLVANKIYNTIVDRIILQTKEDDRLTSGKLTAGDVLYFVYKAVDKDGNTFFGSNMDKASINASSSKANHVVKFDAFLKDDGKADNGDEALLQLINEKIQANLENIELENYIYKALSKTDLENEAVKALKETNPEAKDDEITFAKKEAIKVKKGDKIYISYTRTHTDAEKDTTVTEKAAYEMITLTEGDPFHDYFLRTDSTANVGGTLTVNGNVIKVTIDGIEYTYKDVKILWKVETEGAPIATFEYTPYEKKDDDTTNKVAPTSLYTATGTTTNKIELAGETLTYYVYPVYAIDAPTTEEINAVDILYYINGSALKEGSYEAFKTEGYKNGSETLADLLADVADIFNTTKKDNEFYKEGTDLKKALDEYNKQGGANPTTAQKDANTKAKTALTDAQNAQLKPVLEKIAAAVSGTKVLGDEIKAEYEKNTRHSLKEEYDADIVNKVRKAVLDLVYDCVDVKEEKIPADLIEQFVDHLYESYEYEYYTGSFDSKTTNLEAYKTFELYLEKTLKVEGEAKVRAEIEKKAKEELIPIIKIYVVSKAVAGDAKKVMKSYIESDYNQGAYKIDIEAYEEYYGDKAAQQIKKAEKQAKKSYESDLKNAEMFIVDDAYMRSYKSDVGATLYRNQIKTYGELNLRTSIQFNNLFYYLTCTEIVYNEEEGHAEIAYTEDGTRIDFRTIDYSIITEDEAESDTEADK